MFPLQPNSATKRPPGFNAQIPAIFQVLGIQCSTALENMASNSVKCRLVHLQLQTLDLDNSCVLAQSWLGHYQYQ